ncbi:hypothetical protein JD969_00530 [Planctomycetota bacterium]|nr:hypothetical protein JD969_00530 [Planctomycetota bacterium]
MNQQTETMKIKTVEVKKPVVTQVNDANSGGVGNAFGARGPMNKNEQAEALKKAQQAEKRIQLGMELLKASESRLSAQTQMLNQVRSEQKALREQIQEDVASSLQSYDQWLGQIDESFSKAIQLLEEKVDAVVGMWEKKESKLDGMIQRFERLFEQNQRTLLDVKMHMAAAMDDGNAARVRETENADGEKSDDPDITAEEEAEIYAILNGDVVHEIDEAAEEKEEQVEEAVSEVVEEKEDATDPATALEQLAEQRESEKIYSAVMSKMHGKKKKSDD